ncbi:hypothetical protein GCM10010136_00110 [Limoniibacter endophyticus]|uniref:RES domain-containing protein n=1 Tax=Limoniibacter endophyticus TaxID=1565040 RepID=A0A8J3DJ40_9HYPH|nr:hypothetical protein GCM10010136_00110 [Limoniibacter endophyticus]
MVKKRVRWPKTHRIIRSIHPPIHLFEDIADPHDWEALVAVESKTNPRIRMEIGDLGKVPPARRVSGPGSSLVMAPFVHCSPLHPGRFSDGTFGIYYAADREEVAVAETIHHHASFMRATAERPGWTADFRVLIGSVDLDLDDVSAVSGARNPVDYSVSQKLGAALRDGGSDGLVWESVRMEGGQCIGIFWPDLIPIPTQGRHYSYHWNGSRVDYVRQHDTGIVLSVTE